MSECQHWILLCSFLLLCSIAQLSGWQGGIYIAQPKQTSGKQEKTKCKIWCSRGKSLKSSLLEICGCCKRNPLSNNALGFFLRQSFNMLHRPTNLTPLHLIKILSNIHELFHEEHKMILLINHRGLRICLHKVKDKFLYLNNALIDKLGNT